MKSIIKEILTEIVEEGQQTQSCKADQPTNEFLRGFSLWRTGMCNEDTFKTPKKINELVSKNFKNNIKSIKLDNGTTITKEEYIKRLNDEYQDRIAMCVVPYQGERLKSENVCDSIIGEYNKPDIRTAFNRYMKFPSGCYVFNIETCDDAQPIQSKSITQIPSNVKKDMVKTNTTVSTTEPTQEKNKAQETINKVIKRIKNRFGN